MYKNAVSKGSASKPELRRGKKDVAGADPESESLDEGPGPLPGPGCSELRPQETSRVRRARDGALLGAGMRFGWARWQQAQHLGTGQEEVAEVTVFAPGWEHGWRAALLRTAWLAPPRSPRQQRSAADLTPAQLLLAVTLFVPLLLSWGPHLRGTVTLLAPLAVAWTGPVVLWTIARAATRRRLLIVQGRSPQAIALHRVLATAQQLAAAQQHPVLVPRVAGEAPGVEKAVGIGQEMAWQAAVLVREHTGGAYVDDQLAQLEVSARALAESTLAAANITPTTTQLLLRP